MLLSKIHPNPPLKKERTKTSPFGKGGLRGICPANRKIKNITI